MKVVHGIVPGRPHVVLERAVSQGMERIDLKKFRFQNPFAYLHHCCEHSQSYAAVVQKAVDAHPPSASSPWHIILYQDGVDPSDGLAKNKSRHLVVFYWSFLEFGMDALCHEEVWATTKAR